MSNFLLQLKIRIVGFWLNFKSSRKQKLIALGALIILIILSVTVYWRYFRVESEPPKEEPIVEQPKIYYSSLDGTETSEDLQNRQILSVMVENHPDSRPQAGLDQAGIVYEAIAEGGITRFMALYQKNDPTTIGPVRSARIYYVSWAKEWKALYAHVGGNALALAQIKSDPNFYDMDQFSIGTKAFWRDKSRKVATEHTMFTDSAKLREVARNRNYPTEGNFIPNTFKEDEPFQVTPENPATGQNVEINFSTNTYKIDWIYNSVENNYLRQMAGRAHTDAVSGAQLSAKNVICQYVSKKMVVGGGKDVWSYGVTGEGRAKFMQDGKVIDATWRRPDETMRTKFYDPNGVEISYNRGTTWIEIVHDDTKINFK